jgi:LysR family transcriptional regulator, carnitine catabolism transcriptional activator
MSAAVSIRHLKCFIEVAVQQSISKAAKRLFVSQSALTLTIQQLEAQIKAKLFDRTTRNVALTQTGAAFLPVAQRLVQDFQSALDDVQALGLGQRGHVGVATVPSMMGLLMPQVIAKFARLFSQVTVYAREDNSAGIEQRVATGDVDFGLASPLEQLPGLQYTPLFEDQFSVVCAKDHPLACKKQVKWVELEQYQIIGFSSDTGMQAQLMREANVPECVRKPHYQVSNTATIRDLVQQGLGVSTMPSMAAKREPLSKLACLPLVQPVFKRRICIVQRAQRSLAPAAQAFLDLLLKELPKLKASAHVQLLI